MASKAQIKRNKKAFAQHNLGIKQEQKRIQLEEEANKPKKEPYVPFVLPTENILPDDYPVHWDFIYIVDGYPRRSDIKGTVAQLKADLRKHRHLEALEVRECDFAGRKLEW